MRGQKTLIPGGSVYSCVTLYPGVPYAAFALLLRVLAEMYVVSGSMFVCLMYDTLPPQLQPCSNRWRACCMLYVVWYIAQSTDFRKVKKKKDHAHSPFSMSLLGAIKPQPSCFKLQPSKEPSSTRDAPQKYGTSPRNIHITHGPSTLPVITRNA